jgi:hypothetical protein
MTAKALLIKIDYESRKRLGIFYTPEKVTQILTYWAIRNSDDTIFEPSLGGRFFRSLLSKTKTLGK